MQKRNKMKNVILFLFCIICIPDSAISQKNCASMEVLERQLTENPQLHKNISEIEFHTENFIKKESGIGQRYVITIPTVVHVIYENSTENISDEQILSQIDVLNQDFSATNVDIDFVPFSFKSIVSNTEIQFCLAQQTPEGASTTGITRTKTNRFSWGTNDNVKKSARGGVDPWNSTQYLNIWVCNIGSEVLGYAQFPGGEAETDGVVLDYRYFGTLGTAKEPYNKGRTGTHEVGHWLNLRHIWGDATCGNDFVHDTPQHTTYNKGCPAYPKNSSCNGSPVEMTMNYMDYTNDECMFMFTEGQKARMRAVLEGSGPRSSLRTSKGCDPVNPEFCSAPTGLDAFYISSTNATLSWLPGSNAKEYTFEYKIYGHTTWISQKITETSYSLKNLLPATSYQARVRSNCTNGPGSFSSTYNFSTLDINNCTDTFETNHSRKNAKQIDANNEVRAKISSESDSDWFAFSNSPNQKNIRLSLTNLPSDYDMELYRNSQRVAVSQNEGSSDEEIVFNNSLKATTYYIHVFGFKGAHNRSLCYNLLAETNGSRFKSLLTPEGVDWLPVENEFLVFPNPVSDLVNMSIPFGKQTKGFIQIHDLAGKQIYTQEVEGNLTTKTYQLDVSGFRTGMYLISFQCGQQYFQQKLSVIR